MSIKSKVAVIILDNSHFLDDLSVASLLSLMHDQVGGGSGLRIVLLGDNKLMARIDSIGMHDLAIYDLAIPHMSAAELKTFLAAALPNSMDILSDSSINRIFSDAKGNMHRVVEYAQVSIPSQVDAPAAQEEEAQSFARRIPLMHILAVSVLLAILFWVMLIYQPSDKAEPVLSTLSPIDLNEDHSSNDKKRVDNLAQSERITADSPATIDKITAVRLTEDQPDIKVYSDLVAADDIAAANDAAALDDTAAITTNDPLAPIEVNTDVVSAPEEILRKVSDFSPPKSDSGVREKTAISRLDTLLAKHKAVILSQPDAAFTLQVLALSNRNAVADYINQQSNRNTLLVYKAQRSGKALYMIVSGVYSSKDKAKAAILDLPLKQRQSKPWPREFKSVKADVSL